MASPRRLIGSLTFGWRFGCAGEKARKEKKGYGGKETFAHVPPASADELLKLSKKMNDILQDSKIFPDPASRDWCAPAHARACVSVACIRSRASVRACSCA